MKTKQILYFIGLKILEIGSVLLLIFLPYKIGVLTHSNLCRDSNSCLFTGYWVGGIMFLIGSGLSLLALYILIVGLVQWIKWNWNKAGEMSRR